MSITSTTSLSPLPVNANPSVERQKYRKFFQLKSFICLMGAILTEKGSPFAPF
jgi:hypothetical protein